MKAYFTIPISTILSLGLAACDRKSEEEASPLNIQVSVDYSIARGENPELFRQALKDQLAEDEFPVRWPEIDSSIGIVWVAVEDDHLSEVYDAFGEALERTGDGGKKQIVIRVLDVDALSDSASP